MHHDRYPRTLREAFGPYEAWHIDRRSGLDKISLLGGVVMLLFIGVALAWAQV